MDYEFRVLSSQGKTARTEDWSCASDVEAMERAAREVPSFGAELWRGAERISAFAGPLSADHRPDRTGAKA